MMFIIEGIDGTGKTTLAQQLEAIGWIRFHFGYDAQTTDLFLKYCRVLEHPQFNLLVMDRSFISELVYGPILRESSRLSIAQGIELAQMYAERAAQLVFLSASQATLLQRRASDVKDASVLLQHYDALFVRYNEVIAHLEPHISVLHFDTGVEKEQEHLREIIQREWQA